MQSFSIFVLEKNPAFPASRCQKPYTFPALAAFFSKNTVFLKTFKLFQLFQPCWTSCWMGAHFSQYFEIPSNSE